MLARNQDYLSDLQRNKGGCAVMGKIIKGTINEATTKLRVSSIPNKHQNIIYAYHSHYNLGQPVKKGYVSAYSSNQIPGPGFYHIPEEQKKIQSKKGSNVFASKAKLTTLQKIKSYVPGPGAYIIDQQKYKIARKISKSTQALNKKLQAHQLFKLQIQNAQTKPSVGLYNLNPEKTFKHQKQTSAFKNNIQKFNIQKQKSPPVGHYSLPQSNSNIKKPKKKIKIRQKEQNYQKCKRILNSLKNFDKLKQNIEVGPGFYDKSQIKSYKTFTIKEDIHDRFGELKPIYKIFKSLEEENNQISHSFQNKNIKNNNLGSVFKSKTKRSDFFLENQMDPGIYNSNKSPNKKSHLINFPQKWV